MKHLFREAFPYSHTYVYRDNICVCMYTHTHPVES